MLKFFQMQTRRERTFSKNARDGGSLAFTAVELMVVIAVIALIALLLLPALAKARRMSSHVGCVNNLKQLGIAFKVWEGDKGDRYPGNVLTNAMGGPLYTNSIDVFRYFQNMSNEMSNPQIVVCPEDKKRHPATNFTTDFNSSHISYFLGLNADETHPQLFLVGDSHLTNGQPIQNGLMQLKTNSLVGWTAERHGGAGNIGMADGSVQQLTTSGLQKTLSYSGTNQVLLLPP